MLPAAAQTPRKRRKLQLPPSVTTRRRNLVAIRSKKPIYVVIHRIPLSMAQIEFLEEEEHLDIVVR
jgi:hypothetical protein